MQKPLIYRSLTATDFVDEFRRMNRGSGFTRDGLVSLFHYLEERADACDSPLELDVIDLCVCYSEHPNIESVASDYGVERDENEDDDEFTDRVRDEVENEGYMWKFEGGFMVEDC